MKKPETKTTVEIEGIYLTEEAISEIKSMQNRNNEGIELNIDSIMAGIRYIASHMYLLKEEDFPKAAIVISDLSNVCDNLERLKKP